MDTPTITFTIDHSHDLGISPNAGEGKRHQAQLRAGRAQATIHHETRQQRRARERAGRTAEEA